MKGDKGRDKLKVVFDVGEPGHDSVDHCAPLAAQLASANENHEHSRIMNILFSSTHFLDAFSNMSMLFEFLISKMHFSTSPAM